MWKNMMRENAKSWYYRNTYKSDDSDVEDQHGGGKENIFEDSELKALLAKESCQTQKELA